MQASIIGSGDGCTQVVALNNRIIRSGACQLPETVVLVGIHCTVATAALGQSTLIRLSRFH